MCAGTPEAASNAETTMTQLVQEYTVRAQVRALCAESGVKIDRTEHVANSLGHLAAVVDQLNTLESPTKVLYYPPLSIIVHHCIIIFSCGSMSLRQPVAHTALGHQLIS